MRSTAALTIENDRSRSIYAQGVGVQAAPSRAQRGRRQRTRERLGARLRGQPPLRTDRAAPLEALLGAAKVGRLDVVPFARFVREVESEVGTLEAWVSRAVTEEERMSGPALRRALEWLRRFGRLGVMDFADLPDDARALLVRWLALEHRWCYAAAGTDRDSFKRMAGRTGAR